MLSIFPSLLSYNQLSPFLIRIALGTILVYWAYKAVRNADLKMNMKALAIIEGVSGALLIIGLFSQVVALIIIIDLVIRLGKKIIKKEFLTDGLNYYLVLLIMAISIIVTGAGWYGFDLPL